jgi:multiple sugar transport system ATP-binding protein
VRPADVYLLDEPLSHLDAKLRAAMRAELKQLGELSGTTTLYVTHDYQEALALGDRIGVLREGRLVQVGTPVQVWTEPVDTFVARALGQPEMNLLDAGVEGGIARVGEAFTVGVPPDADGAVQVGIRPRDLEIVSGDPPAERLVLRGQVALAERLGRLVELSVDVAGVRIITVTSDHRVHEGDSVTLAADWGRVHVFGADGARLGAAQRPEGAALTGGTR